MATIQGTAGSVTLPTGFSAKIASWSADVQIGVADTSGFTDNGYRTKAPTIVSMVGSCSGTADDGSILPATLLASTALLTDLKGTLQLTASSTATSCHYTGTAIITGLDMTRPVDGKMDVTFNFKYTGTISQQWDES